MQRNLRLILLCPLAAGAENEMQLAFEGAHDEAQLSFKPLWMQAKRMKRNLRLSLLCHHDPGREDESQLVFQHLVLSGWR